MRLLLLLVLFGISACASLGRPTQDMVHVGADAERLIVVAVDNPMTTAARRAGGTPRGYGASRYRVSPAAQLDMQSVARAHGLTRVDSWPIEVLGVHCAVLRIDAGTSLVTTLQRLQADPRVVLAQPLQTFSTRAGVYNDPYADLQVSLDDMNVRNAHGLATGKGVRVAVVDTGVDIRHPDLAGRVIGKEDFVRRDFRGFAQDRHGTAIAGVIAAAANNSVGIVGVAPDARLLALKACWYQEESDAPSAARCNSFTLARAIASAIEGEAQVINLSLTGPTDPLLERLLNAAMKRGIHVIAAADGDASFPASMQGIIGVRMTESTDADSTRSYVRAPGREVLTLRPQAHYDFESGSSIAAANVTGVVALLLQHRAGLSSEEIRALLETSTSSLAVREGTADRSIDACAAVATLLSADDCPQQLVRTARRQDQKKPLSPTK